MSVLKFMCMYDVIVIKFTCAISSSGELLVIHCYSNTRIFLSEKFSNIKQYSSNRTGTQCISKQSLLISVKESRS